MATIDALFDALDGPTVIASKTGIPLTTVHSWKSANFIPEWRRAAIIKLAKSAGVILSDSDFPPISERVPRKERAASGQAGAS